PAPPSSARALHYLRRDHLRRNHIAALIATLAGCRASRASSAVHGDGPPPTAPVPPHQPTSAERRPVAYPHVPHIWLAPHQPLRPCAVHRPYHAMLARLGPLRKHADRRRVATRISLDRKQLVVLLRSGPSLRIACSLRRKNRRMAYGKLQLLRTSLQ